MATQWYSVRQDTLNYLTTAQKENNVTCLWERLSPLGFTAEAVAAIAGNMEYEGLLNPGQYEYGYNYSLSAGGGLCGWTPIYDANDTLYQHLKNWCDYYNLNHEDGDAQCSYINYELTDWNLTNPGNPVERFMPLAYAPDIGMPVNPPITASAFIVSTLSPDLLSNYWVCYYERPGRQQLNDTAAGRASAALNWYSFISGLPPVPPTPGRTGKLPLWMMVSRKRLYRKRRF